MITPLLIFVVITTGAIATDAVVTYGIGIGPIFLDDLRCLGNESEILSCPSSGLGRHNCGHSEDVAVVCNKTVTPCAYSAIAVYTA